MDYKWTSLVVKYLMYYIENWGRKCNQINCVQNYVVNLFFHIWFEILVSHLHNQMIFFYFGSMNKLWDSSHRVEPIMFRFSFFPKTVPIYFWYSFSSVKKHFSQLFKTSSFFIRHFCFHLSGDTWFYLDLSHIIMRMQATEIGYCLISF